MGKILMVIGAGKFQLPAIIKAKEMGLKVLATDLNPSAPGFEFADFHWVVDVKDMEANLQVAKEFAINGVISIASEVSVRTVAAVAEELRLPGLSHEVARIVTDKALMREKYAKQDVPSPMFRVAYSLEEALKSIEELSLPAVIKPVDNAGSRGVARVDSEHQIESAFEKAKKFSEQGKVLIESFMEGVEVSAEAFVYRGEIKILSLSDKIRTPPPYLLDTTVIFPSNYPKEVQDKVCEVAKKAIKAVGINDGPVHIEIMMTPDGPMMVELAARGPGFKVFTDMIPYVTGVDVTEGIIRLALGEEPDLEIRANQGSVLKFIEAAPGRIKGIKGKDQVRNISGVFDFELYLGVGDKIRPLTCGDDRVGHIISFADSREKALEVIEKAERLLEIEVESV